MNKRLKKALLVLVLMLSTIFVAACAFFQHPKFNGTSDKERMKVVQQSPNFRHGEFQNQIPTPMFTTDSSFLSVLVSNLFTKSERLKPEGAIHAVKTDLKSLPADTDIVVWFGHSSYFIQIAGKRILVDPVFSSYASPLPMFNRAFEGTNIYSAQDMPEIDYLLITHDHWDHLDYASVRALAPKIGKVICGLGVDAYFQKWGYPSEKIQAADWGESFEFEPGFSIHVLPARHYSGRLLSRNKTLWVGYALVSPEYKLFLSGDSGYGPHFAEIGKAFKGFDLAILDVGQYDKQWAYIHMNPEDAVRAATDLQAREFLPGHIGRFAIARHPWDEPFKRVKLLSEGKSFHLLTPEIGVPLPLSKQAQIFSSWWARHEKAVAP